MEPIVYTGKGDAFIDFTPSAPDFAMESSFDKIFRVKVVNASATDLAVLLNPSYSPSLPASVIKDGTIVYASGKTDLTASGSPTSIAELLAFVKANPSRVVKMLVKSNNAAQLSQALIFSRKSPFTTPQSDRINIESYTDEYASNDKLATIRAEFQIDDQTELSCVVPAAVGGVATETTFTFYFGATLNTATALRNKTAIALQSPQVASAKTLTRK